MVLGKEEVERSPRLNGTVLDDREGSEATRREDELLAVIGHELRSPLAAIRNGLAMLRMRGDENAATRAWAQDMVERQVGHVGCLIEELLDYSRIRQGKTPLRKRRVDLARVVNEAIETVRPCIEEHDHALEVKLPSGPATLEAAPTLLEQVFTNLLVNAAKYTNHGGRIRLTVLPEGNDLVIRVRDNGIGITADVLPQVFEFFRQSPSATDHSAGGLGIGLALVRQIVEMHGGSVSAASAGLGQGSEFVVRLPQAP